MVCEEAQFLSSLLVDGQLSEEEAAQLHQHFQLCPQCKLNFQSEVNLKACLKKKAKAHQVPDSLLMSVKNMLAHPEHHPIHSMSQSELFPLNDLRTQIQTRKRTLAVISLLLVLGFFIFYWMIIQH